MDEHIFWVLALASDELQGYVVHEATAEIDSGVLFTNDLAEAMTFDSEQDAKDYRREIGVPSNPRPAVLASSIEVARMLQTAG